MEKSIENELEHYSKDEILKILENEERLCYVRSSKDSFFIRESDIPDFVVEHGKKYKEQGWGISRVNNPTVPILIFKGDTIKTFRHSSSEIVGKIEDLKDNKENIKKVKVVNVNELEPILLEFYKNYKLKEASKDTGMSKKER